MPSLRIPSRYHGAIKQMAQLSPDELSCIQEFIRNAEYPYKVDPSNKTTDPAKQIIETYSPVLEFITSLFYLIQVGSSRKAEEVGEGINYHSKASAAFQCKIPNLQPFITGILELGPKRLLFYCVLNNTISKCSIKHTIILFDSFYRKYSSM